MPIPPHHEAIFRRLTDAARKAFGKDHVSLTLLDPDTDRVPSLEVPGLSFIGEQWIVVTFAGGRRLELEWNEPGVDRAFSLLERRQRRMTIDKTAPEGPAGWIEALVGTYGRVTVHAPVAEFDLEVRVVPDRSSALPFHVHVRYDGNVVVEGSQLRWWTFGAGRSDDEGMAAAKDLIEQVVLYGGSIRRTWRGVTLLDEHGDHFSGPIPGPRLPFRPQRLHFRAYS
ncbi:hypothetical protein [Frigoribacterium sp. CFBP 8751]|uniref:hypothetical protein n=1 Tax=Frigoribacterium sp. CFBP 8751 TaxID=2775277 RepID=UPI00177A8FFC|nr:hypothetical protein [Frigoribacterium sp. CFBP 8751]MBD8540436.1 hypothetical protein [Frigoribacterium sp. CFBP 8751]